MGVPVRPVHPLAIAALTRLSGAWPRRLSFPDVLDAAGGGESDADNLCEILLGCYSAGIIEAHLHAPHFAAEAGERPLASGLARLQLREENVGVNVNHTLVQIPDETTLRLMQLLDGTRDRQALVRELGIPEEDVDRHLRQIAGMALLLE